MRGFIPIPVNLILAAMVLNPNGCCGTSCGGGLRSGSFRQHVVLRNATSDLA
jgi:hypothetical protein